MSEALEAVLRSIDEGQRLPLYLVAGDRVLAEPAAIQLGQALGKSVGCEPEIHRRPADLGSVLADLKTYSLFAPAKVVVVVESSVLADSGAAADLLDEAVEALPVGRETVELSTAERRAAGRLLQTLRLFQIDPATAAPEEVLSSLPPWALKGGTRYRQAHGNRPRGPRQVEEVRAQLAELLDAALSSGLRGWADTDVGELADAVERGLPDGHALVLAESAVAKQHPLVETLQAQDALVAVGRVAVAKGGGWQGVELLSGELQRETGVGIAGPALQELARRTIVRSTARGSGPDAVDADSTARFAAEYRKLATMVSGDSIDRQLVEATVEDRGDEDAWKILDAIGAGDLQDALHRMHRLLSSAEDPIAARLVVLLADRLFRSAARCCCGSIGVYRGAQKRDELSAIQDADRSCIAIGHRRRPEESGRQASPLSLVQGVSDGLQDPGLRDCRSAVAYPANGAQAQRREQRAGRGSDGPDLRPGLCIPSCLSYQRSKCCAAAWNLESAASGSRPCEFGAAHFGNL